MDVNPFVYTLLNFHFRGFFMRFVSIKLIIQKYHEEIGFQLHLVFHSSTEHEYKFILESSSIKSFKKLTKLDININ